MATTAGIACLGALIFATGLLGAGCGIYLAHRHASSAADLAALAGASQLDCGAAAEVASANQARLTDCTLTDDQARVVVEVDGPQFLGHRSTITATALAGVG